MKNEIINKLLSLGVQLKIIDGNLKVNAPKGVLTKELLEEIKEHKAYLISLISSNTSISKAKVLESYPLTPTQYFMWFTHEYLGGNRAYNITSTLKLCGKLDAALLEKAFQKVIARHESLRTIFRKNQEEEIQQYILAKEEANFKLQIVASEDSSVEQFHNQIKQEYQKAFDLEKDLLLSATLFKRNEEEHILLFVLHHIIGDGWSLQILTREVMLVYTSLANKEEIKLAELSIQYKDYSEWLNEKLTSPEYSNKLDYWKQQFETKSPVLNLVPGKRPVMKTYNGNIRQHEFSKPFLATLNAFGKEQQMTLFMLLVGGLNGLFSRYTTQTDITLGTTVAGREHSDFENQIGLYSNALPIRTQFNKEDSFLELMQKQKQTLIKAYENKEYPFTALVNQLALPKDQSRSPLFDIMVLLQNHQGLELNDQKGIDGITATEYSEIERGVSQLDISFVFVESEKGLTLNVEYNTDIYTEDFIGNLLDHFEAFLTAGLRKPEQAIHAIEIVSPVEKNKILNEFNPIVTPYDASLTVVNLIQAEAKENPNQAAFVHQGEKISYAHLEEYSTKLANCLAQQFNIKKGDFVGIELERNPWMIIAIIGVLKAGAVYVPIDPAYPEARKNYIQQDSECKLVINTEIVNEFKSNLDKYAEESFVTISPKDLAYVIYTSGSTGNPKGVQITHESFVDYVLTFKNHFQLTAQDSVVQQASISFDTSIEEIFPILISGGTLFFHDDKGDFEALFRLCEQHHITVLSTNPYALQYLNDVYDQYNLSLRTLISGGDTLQADHISNLWDKFAVFNTYGPTESTVCATYYQITKKETVIPIGKPIVNRQVYILESDTTQLTPVGIIGELCISGKGVAAGYLNQPELTKEKFVTNPFKTDAVMYRTGDLGYWMSDGNIGFIGRKDHQIKIRGYRVELGEIEHALQEDQTVTTAVVLAKERAGELVLVAYVVGVNINIEVLKKSLRSSLPEYMIPGFYVELESIPLTSNGKIDKKALLAIEDLGAKNIEYVAPTSDLESQMVLLWEEILGISKIGITTSFFDLGGHSLKVIRLINKLEKLGYKLKVKDVFESPTILGIIEKLQQSSSAQIIKVPEQEFYPVTSSQRRLWTLSQFEGGNAAYNIANVLELKGKLDLSLFQQSVDKLIERHESLRTVFKANESGVLSQYVLGTQSVNCPIVVHHGLNEEEIAETVNRHVNHAFNLGVAPLLKVEIISLNEAHHLLLFNLHHIVGDGWSMEILSREIVAEYNNLKQASGIKLAELPIQYKDYAHWYNSAANQEKVATSGNYWREQFAGDLPVLELSTMATRPKVKTYNGANVSHTFSIDFISKVRSFCQQNEATLFMALMAGLNGLFYRYSGQTDIVLGTPVAGRAYPDLEDQIGLYLNTLAIRTRFEVADTYASLVKKQKNVLLDGYDNQSYPFDVLVEELQLKRDLSRSALFDVMVVLHNQQDLFSEEETFAEIEIAPYKKIQKTTSQFDLSFSFAEGKESLSLTLNYNTDIYTEDFVQKLIQYLERFIAEGIEKPAHNIAKIDFVPAEEKQRLLYTYNAIDTDYPKNRTIVDLVTSQTRKTPDAIALVCEDKTITYKELAEKSNQLAQYLLHHSSVSPGDFVGIKVKRDEWLVIAILAVLKAGATYVPIDLNYPEERIAYIEQDSCCKVVITEKLLQDFKQAVIPVADLAEIKITSDSLAYLIYTSGSTGKPKGVMLTHDNAVAFLDWSMEEFATADFEILYAATSHCFDLSVFEMFYPLSTGKKIRIITNGLSIADYVDQDEKILINTVPSVVDNLLEREISLKNVSVLNMAGEPIPIALSNALIKYPIEIRNLYGPSEDTTYSTCYRIDKRHEHSLPIGRPISNTRFYIVSEELALQGEGLIGEICISGRGLAVGYMNQPELTTEKFIPNPFDSGTLMYRTGDLGYWMPDKNLGFAGRKDDQIKIRGYRIELGEIEHALQEEENISNAVVLTKEHDGEKQIVSYLKGENIDIQQIRSKLSKKIPGYMLPTCYLLLDEIPLTANGKVDKTELLKLEVFKIKTSDYVAPSSETEARIVEIWQEILGLEKIGVTDDFFDLGGHSLKATELLSVLQKQFDVSINIQELFMRPTIQNLAVNIENVKWLEEMNNEQSVKKILI
ncbi:non-ribosomal peptide synthetase [Flavobacterium poyangense]|uniref:non-ribosomal peptide synthetase n=1 Tax=Flavobacterium poyangense TaxID=2204302 RepID=UPI0014224155|nr:non-ribosomal peptide synthetase [Flavobacterium sp. JXAS1]